MVDMYRLSTLAALILIGLFILSGCEAKYSDGAYKCGELGLCPRGQFCRDGFCHRTKNPTEDGVSVKTDASDESDTSVGGTGIEGAGGVSDSGITNTIGGDSSISAGTGGTGGGEVTGAAGVPSEGNSSISAGTGGAGGTGGGEVTGTAGVPSEGSSSISAGTGGAGGTGGGEVAGAAGVLSTCVPSTEICNGRDDNCDGTIDDGGNDLCGGTNKKCGGKPGCVECLKKDDCTVDPSVCKVYSCDASNRCVKTNATDRDQCKTAKGNDGQCSAGTCVIPDGSSLKYAASENFESARGIQGIKHWYYQELRLSDGAYSNMLNWVSTESYWRGSEEWVRIGDGWQHPGEAYDSVRKWAAPYNGTITITGTAKIEDAGSDGVGKDDGVTVTIKNQNGTTLWSDTIGATDSTGYSHNITTDVVVNGAIYFIGHMNSASSYYTIGWDPTIAYTAY